MSVLIEFNEMKQEEESWKVKNNRPERLAHFSFWIPSLAGIGWGEKRVREFIPSLFQYPGQIGDKSVLYACMTLDQSRGEGKELGQSPAYFMKSQDMEFSKDK